MELLASVLSLNHRRGQVLSETSSLPSKGYTLYRSFIYSCTYGHWTGRVPDLLWNETSVFAASVEEPSHSVKIHGNQGPLCILSRIHLLSFFCFAFVLVPYSFATDLIAYRPGFITKCSLYVIKENWIFWFNYAYNLVFSFKSSYQKYHDAATSIIATSFLNKR